MNSAADSTGRTAPARSPRRGARAASAGARGRLVAPLAVLVLAAGTGCGGSGSAAGPTTGAAGSGSSTPAPSATVATTSGTPHLESQGATGPLPGTSYEAGLHPGQPLAVLGVVAGKNLPLRARPGSGAVLATVPALATGLIATGRARLVTSGATRTPWAEVTVRGVTGWLDARHLAQPADATDLTAQTITKLGSRPTAATMLDLGMIVAKAWASTEPRSTLTVSVAPTTGDLGEVTVDVVGLGDDSVAGQRLHVFGTPGKGSFTLKSVEATPFCYRGVSTDGRCR